MGSEESTERDKEAREGEVDEEEEEGGGKFIQSLLRWEGRNDDKEKKEDEYDGDSKGPKESMQSHISQVQFSPPPLPLEGRLISKTVVIHPFLPLSHIH